MMTAAERVQFIRERLTKQLHPSALEVHDQSERHRGHPGSASGGGHFEIKIAAAIFQNKPLLECHRMIYAALDDAIPSEIHALSIKIIKP